MKEEDEAKLFKITMFDENDLHQHQMKMITIFGIFFGLRGNKENTFLLVSNISQGWYHEGHVSFAGLEWYGLKDLTDKTKKINLQNSFARDKEDFCKYPVLDNLLEDVGGSIKRFLAKLPKGKAGNRFYRKISKDKTKFCNQVLGEKSIRDLNKEAFRHLGVSNWDTLRPHAKRGVMINKLVNDPGVSLTECMGAVRHNSASANLMYQKRSSTSESARVDALLGGAATAQRERNAKQKTLSPDNKIATPPFSQKGSLVEVSSPFVTGTSHGLANCEIVEVSSHQSTSSSTAPSEIILEDSVNDSVPYTQIQMEYLENEMREIQHGRMTHNRSPPPQRIPPTNRSRAVFHRERGGAQRHGNRHSFPPFRESQIGHRSHPYGRVNLNRPEWARHSSMGGRPRPSARDSSMGGRPRPSAREREIMSMRRRLREMSEQDELESFPYRSNEHEQESLYSDYLEYSDDFQY